MHRPFMARPPLRLTRVCVLPARGCYSVSAAPGSGVCRETRGGACVRYAEEVSGQRKSLKAIDRQTSGTCPEANSGDSQTGQCKNGKCDVWIGGGDFCSQCSQTTDYLINGKCTADNTENACEGSASNGACTSCAQGFFLHRGGCYNVDTAPGNLICSAIDETNTAVCKTCAAGYFKNPVENIDATHQSCIACSDTTGADSNAGVANCATCDPPETSGGAATCTVCADGYYGSGSPLSCTVCTDPCATCTASATDKCTSCKEGDTPYFKKGESNDGTATCVSEETCKTDSTHFPTTDANQKKTCTLCNDAANGGVDGCKTCTPKVAASLAETPSVTCSVCTTEGKKPNKAGTKCFDCQVTGCSHCSADGVCEACDGKKVSPGGSSCATDCPENSTGNENACICNSGFAPNGDSYVASSSINLSTGAIAGISVITLATCPVLLIGYLPLHNEQSEQSQHC